MEKTNLSFYSFLILCICFLSALGCVSSSSFMERQYIEPQGNRITTVLKSNSVFSSGAMAAQIIFRDTYDWRLFLEEYPTRQKDYAHEQFAGVDYERHMVVGILLGSRGNGQSVAIDSVVSRSDRLIVHATEYIHGTGRRVFMNPSHFIVVDKQDLPVEFAPITVRSYRQGKN